MDLKTTSIRTYLNILIFNLMLKTFFDASKFHYFFISFIYFLLRVVCAHVQQFKSKDLTNLYFIRKSWILNVQFISNESFKLEEITNFKKTANLIISIVFFFVFICNLDLVFVILRYRIILLTFFLFSSSKTPSFLFVFFHIKFGSYHRRSDCYKFNLVLTLFDSLFF